MRLPSTSIIALLWANENRKYTNVFDLENKTRENVEYKKKHFILIHRNF